MKYASLLIALFVFVSPQLHAQTEIEVVRNLNAAFNAHDVEGMMKWLHDDIKWFYIQGDNMDISTSGKAELRAGMESYFDSLPSARSESVDEIINGPFIAIKERAMWKTSSGEQRSQTALGIYEVIDGKVKRVWYYPEVR